MAQTDREPLCCLTIYAPDDGDHSIWIAAPLSEVGAVVADQLRDIADKIEAGDVVLSQAEGASNRAGSVDGV